MSFQNASYREEAYFDVDEDMSSFFKISERIFVFVPGMSLIQT